MDEIKSGKRIATHYIRVPSSSSYVEPIHIKLIETTPLPVTPSPNVVTGIATDNNQLLRGDVRLLAGTGIQLQQDNSAKTITIVNTGGGGDSDGGGVSAHNLLSDTHSDTQPTLVQRGMLIVGRLVGTIVKWAGLALGAAGKFLKSTGTDVVWGDVDWTEVQNKPSTFPPSAHAHNAADVVAGQFGANTGGGDYSFPGKVGIGTTAPNSRLHVAGSISVAITRKTAHYTLTDADCIVTCDASAGAFTIRLPSAVGIAGRMYTIKKVDSSFNAVTVAPPSGQTIDGAPSYVLSFQWQYVTIVSDGSNWLVIASKNVSEGGAW